MNRSVDFFDTQFKRQVAAGELALNPFETLVLPALPTSVRGRVLELGCGLGNLSLEAARRGARVTAVDASTTAIVRIVRASLAENLGIAAVISRIESYKIAGSYDAIVAIGLLMFMPREAALRLLAEMKEHVAPGGRLILNVLVEGTTYLEMFDPRGYCLFGAEELERLLAPWTIELARRETFDAPGGTKKAFSTVVARRP
ncbi:MAG TPA: class I SAM-dependent methyltransferase [Burkholderiales bacterium]|nr:class I SAM-dependent methyltransferase [Burkholderiales bacterium]